MKKLIAVILLGCASVSMADMATITRSTFSLTNELATVSTTPVAISAIIVGKTSSNGILTIYNSSSTNVLTVAVSSITLGTIGYYDMKDLQVKGLTYNVVSNSSGFVILYKNR